MKKRSKRLKKTQVPKQSNLINKITKPSKRKGVRITAFSITAFYIISSSGCSVQQPTFSDVTPTTTSSVTSFITSTTKPTVATTTKPSGTTTAEPTVTQTIKPTPTESAPTNRPDTEPTQTPKQTSAPTAKPTSTSTATTKPTVEPTPTTVPVDERELLLQDYNQWINANNFPTYALDYKVGYMDRYLDYKIKNMSLDWKLVALRVNIGLDKPFYTDIRTLPGGTHPLDVLTKYVKYSSTASTTDDFSTLPSSYSIGTQKVSYHLIDDLNDLIAGAKSAGFNPQVIRAYLSYDEISTLYNEKVISMGESQADRYYARPGHSLHQGGGAIIFNSEKLSDWDTSGELYNFGVWLEKNAYKYGFIQRYPRNKDNITGYAYQPYYYIWVGHDNALGVNNSGLTYDEYHYFKNESYDHIPDLS